MVGIHSGSHATHCGTLTTQTCQAAADVGTTIGAGIVIALWVAVDVILGVTFLVLRLSRR
ncbi:hypothetical protein [Acidimicrobium ferrooxidans]|uniref:hypothetical protein n=1 Tax=Acidimicrobium ferrooxidans TaxID=53635 RepID=UPI0002F0CE20|nr:hypothetical protein [Acidimicrobium ferrooxidans]